jgi:hypothetical protein
MKQALLSLMAAFIPALAVADASDSSCAGVVYDALERHLGIDKFAPVRAGRIIVAEACKPLPHDPSRLLAAFAYDTGVEYQKSLVLALVDAKALRVIADYRDTIAEDAVTAVGEHSLTLDTAAYQLAPGLRAFGVRFTSSAVGPSCAGASEWDELTLVVQEKDKLQPVMRRAMQFQAALRGCIGKPTGHDIWEHGKRTITVASTRTHGLADLLITETVTIVSSVDPIPAGIKPGPKTRRHLLKYDGKTYR